MSTTVEVVCSGFKELKASSSSDGDGVVTVELDGEELVLRPTAGTGFWRKTYSPEPALVIDNAPFLYYTLRRDDHYTVETHFVLTAACEYDQAGLVIRLDAEHWITAGIIYVDGTPSLSCVVTNGYSDRSSQPWKEKGTGTQVTFSRSATGDSNITKKFPECRIRIHCMGTSFIVEAWIGGAWECVRVTHLSCTNSNTRPDPLEPRNCSDASDEAHFFAGIFAACPDDQQGGAAHFTHFEICKGSECSLTIQPNERNSGKKRERDE